jgi:curved DNA-binding protein CbpA
MKNLYDLLGVRPDDDPENLKTAYRKAAKASHPDHHGGDPAAAVRFRQVTRAYDILRHAERRAAYDRLLQARRRPLRTKLKRGISDLMHHILGDLAAMVFIAILLAGGYAVYAHIAEIPIDKAAGTIADGAAPAMPIVLVAVSPTANDPDVLETMKVEEGPAGQTADIAGRDGDDKAGVAIDQASATADAGDPEKSQGVDLTPQHKTQSADVPLSGLRRQSVVPDPSSSGGTAFDNRRGSKTHELVGRNTGEVSLLQTETKLSARPLTAVKPYGASRPPVEQVLLESRNTSACTAAQSCSVGVPPLFGVGF